MNISGKQYAKVSDRLKAFLKDYPNGCIDTSYEVLLGGVVFKTIVSIPAKGKTATGHAWTRLDKPKALEKCESISLGRCLAMLGYHADGEISSYEEMQDFRKEDAEFQSKLKTLIFKVEDVLDRISFLTPEQEQGIRALFLTERYDDLYRQYLGLLEMEKDLRKEESPSMKEINEKVLDKLKDPQA